MLSPLRQWLLPAGVRLPAHKQRSLRSRIMPVPLPQQLCIPILACQQAMVSRGDRVLPCQLLAAADDPWLPRTHSPAGGVISAIEQQPTLTGGPEMQTTIVLDVDREQDAASACLPALADYRAEQPDTILERLRLAGVHSGNRDQDSAAAVLHRGRSKQADVVIVNGVESEPYVCADEALLREHADKIVRGAAMLQYAGLAKRCVIAVQRGKREAIAAINRALDDSDIELYLAPARYPSGHPGQLVSAICGREIITGTSPEQNGAMIVGVNAARAAWQAVQLGLPDTHHVVTLAGASLRTPKNFDVPTGTAAGHLLELCGLDHEQHSRTVLDNPLLGKLATTLSAPVQRLHKALIAADADEFAPAGAVSPCIHCGRCADACPVNLQPHLLEIQALHHDSVQLHSLGLSDCIECAACNVVCPSNRPLLQTFSQARLESQRQSQQARLSQHWQQRFQFHQYRMKRHADARQERRAEKSLTREAAATGSFSRDQARQEIADAVARVRARRAGTKNPNDKDKA